MDWQGALRARLLAASPVTDLVAQRVTWVDRPQAAALPAITLQTVFESRPQHMKGFDGLNVSTVQIDVWAASHAQASQIADAVIAATVPAETSNGVRFDRGFVNQLRDLGERVETQFIHRTSIDFTIHHATA